MTTKELYRAIAILKAQKKKQKERLEGEVNKLRSMLAMFPFCPCCAGSLRNHPLDHKPDCAYLKASKE